MLLLPVPTRTLLLFRLVLQIEKLEALWLFWFLLQCSAYQKVRSILEGSQCHGRLANGGATISFRFAATEMKITTE